MSNFSIESCITSVHDGITAFQKGAHRLEACTRLETEGMTPELDWVEALCQQVDIPVRVMIRETENGFEANDQTLDQMIRAIEKFKTIPVEGLVLGVMKNRRIDKEAMTALIQIASPFSITFHKAIDHSEKIMDDIEWLNEFPIVDTILTSGGKEFASDGTDQILEMKNHFDRNIMAGGKITQQNLNAIHDVLQLRWYHGKNIV